MKLSGLILILFFSAASLFAQTSGGLTGRVTDSTGAALPGVTVEAKSPSLQGTRTVVTESDGAYRLALLPPGEYTVQFNLSGFAPLTRNRITVALGKDTALDATLRPAAVAEMGGAL